MTLAPHRRLGLGLLLAFTVTLLPATSLTALAAKPTVGVLPQIIGSYSKNLYDSRAVRYQNPDMTACTASSALMMLNMIRYAGTGGSGFRWTATTSYTTQSSMMTWARANDTLAASGKGSDPHGWRNTLNHYGWNSFKDPATRIYDDAAFGSYDAAVKAAIGAIARTGRPVGILTWAGGHAHILHGYTVYGRNPAVSDSFAVQSVIITDPLQSNGLRNARISDQAYRSGSLTYRFRPYEHRDSPHDDPYTPGTQASHDEWYGKWVIVMPVR